MTFDPQPFLDYIFQNPSHSMSWLDLLAADVQQQLGTLQLGTTVADDNWFFGQLAEQ